MRLIDKLSFAQAQLGAFYALSESLPFVRLGLGMIQEALQAVIYSRKTLSVLETERIEGITLQLKRFNDSHQSHLVVPTGEHSILPGASYEGALAYVAIASVDAIQSDLSIESGSTEDLLLEAAKRFLTISARNLDEKGGERVWRPQGNKDLTKPS